MEKEIIPNEELISIYNNYKTLAVNTISQVNQYTWDDGFCREQIRKAEGQLYEYFTEIDFSTFTPDELKQLGFGMCDDEEEDVLYLSPIWAIDAFKQGTILHSISGDTNIVGIDELDKNIRMGKTAHGLRKSQLMKAIRNEKLDELGVE